MKKRIISILIAVAITLPTIAVCGVSASYADISQFAAENESSKLEKALDKPLIGNALEILRYLAKLPSLYDDISKSPTFEDAMEILRCLAKLPSKYDNVESDTAAVTESESDSDYTIMAFGEEIISIDIKIDNEDWQDFLKNATKKEWYEADVVINSELFESVGFRAKGNSSLSSARGRYSLNFRMDKYVDGQTYYGLDRFCVNNMMGDATYMKDYIAYDIMDFIGVETPLKNYASVSVNGEDYMFGVALERYNKSFLDRVYDTTKGFLYSVKISMGARGEFEGIGRPVGEAPVRIPPNFGDFGDLGDLPEGFGGGNMIIVGGNGVGGIGGMNGGGSLVYTDGEVGSYPSIFDNNVFNRTTEEDNQRVIEAIKNLNEGTDLEKYFNVDQILRYFAAHTITVNLDSYVSNMAQNYYIYEYKGKLSILPWDYNLAFGGFQSGNGNDFVNFPIDTPVSGVKIEDRPLLDKLLEVDEYKEKYHSYLREIVEDYFESGLFEETVNALDGKIKDCVKNDVNPFHTYEQYETSLDVFVEACMLRAKSVAGQLDGTIPSTTDGQNADKSALIDASHLNMNALGSMGGGFVNREIPGDFPGGFPEGFPGGQVFDRQSGREIPLPDGREFPSGFDFPDAEGFMLDFFAGL